MHSDRVGTVIKACEEVEDSEERGGIRMVGVGVGVNFVNRPTEGYDEADCCRKSLEGVCGVIQEGNIIAPIGLL